MKALPGEWCGVVSPSLAAPSRETGNAATRNSVCWVLCCPCWQRILFALRAASSQSSRSDHGIVLNQQRPDPALATGKARCGDFSRSPSKAEANAAHRKGGNSVLPSSSPSHCYVRLPKGCCWLVAGLAGTESGALMHTDILTCCRHTQKGLGLHFKLLLVF